jgi:hypothetical protein
VYYERAADLTGIANGKVGTISLWLKIPSTIVDNRFLFISESLKLRLIFGGGDGRVNLLTYNGAPGIQMWLATTSEWDDGDTHHFIYSWDMSVPSSHCYVDGTDDLTANTETDIAITYTGTGWALGDVFGGGAKLAWEISEFYWAQEYIDLSEAANRAKFRSSSGKPVYLGSDGSIPTGTAPIIYLPDGDATNNQGTGGNFTETDGTAVRVVGPGSERSQAAKISLGMS